MMGAIFFGCHQSEQLLECCRPKEVSHSLNVTSFTDILTGHKFAPVQLRLGSAQESSVPYELKKKQKTLRLTSRLSDINRTHHLSL